MGDKGKWGETIAAMWEAYQEGRTGRVEARQEAKAAKTAARQTGRSERVASRTGVRSTRIDKGSDVGSVLQTVVEEGTDMFEDTFETAGELVAALLESDAALAAGGAALGLPPEVMAILGQFTGGGATVTEDEAGVDVVGAAMEMDTGTIAIVGVVLVALGFLALGGGE